jgi:hypothetical protein
MKNLNGSVLPAIHMAPAVVISKRAMILGFTNWL